MTQFVKKFGNIQQVLKIPHLLELQTKSYHRFLQREVSPAGRADFGLEGVFRSVFPIQDFNKTATLEFVSYDIGQPKFDVNECLAKGLSYEAPVRIKVRLVVYDVDEDTGNRSIRDIKEQDIYFGTIPLMTEKGTFIINGTERVIVNQLQRSPGIIFEHDFGKSHTSRKVLYSSRIIPMRGSWLDFEFDHKDIFYVRIDRRRKMPVTILLRAMGLSSADILRHFYQTEYYQIEELAETVKLVEVDKQLASIDESLRSSAENHQQEMDEIAEKQEFLESEKAAAEDEIKKLNEQVSAAEELWRQNKEALENKKKELGDRKTHLLSEKEPEKYKKNLAEVDKVNAEIESIDESLRTAEEQLQREMDEIAERKASHDSAKSSTEDEIKKLIKQVSAKEKKWYRNKKDLENKKIELTDRKGQLELQRDDQLPSRRVFREIQEPLSRKEALFADVQDDSGKVIGKAGDLINQGRWRRIVRSGITRLEVDPAQLIGQYLADDVVHPETGEVLGQIGEQISELFLDVCRNAFITRLPVFYITGVEVSATVIETMQLDKTTDMETAQVEIFRRLRPSSPPTQEVATTFFDNLFRNPDYYDLSPVGRYKLNIRLGLDAPLDQRTLTNEDILKAVKQLQELKDNHGPSDDIDHLGNRRVRPVGELVENQYRIGLVRMERAIKERMSLQDVATLMPHDLINPKPVVAAIKEFFGTSQLSQFMDQTNPLSEVTHKRRLSALGPGGLTRDRAGFEVRDVHTSHYGRICPIETPEGPNIGLIVSLTTHAQVNAFGFIESPYRVVRDGQVTQEVKFHDASREGREIIAQANAPLDEEGRFVNEMVTAREKGDFALKSRDEITLMDISPSQIVSVSASLIPFLEHDDANRALMGSNMQRQAVPLLRCEQPIVGTGMESIVAQDSGSCVLAVGQGRVRYVDAERIVVSYEGEHFPETGGMKVYELQKFHKSNQNTCFGQKPLVVEGQTVVEGMVLADGPGVKNGELALGKNLLVAFMPWCGYNFEDSILISERVVRDDVFTSIHIEEFEIVARDTKLGPEEVTRDIPNMGEEMLRNLDDSGIIRIGARVQPDDILVGKITPKGETQLTPEEKLLRAIFGDKARDVKNSSLKVPPGIEGTIIDVRVFNRRMGDKDERSKDIEAFKLASLEAREKQIIAGLTGALRDKLWESVKGKRLAQTVKGKRKGEILAEANKTMSSREALDKIPLKKLANLFVDKKINELIQSLLQGYDKQIKFVRESYKIKSDRITDGDDLPPGVIKMVKVYVAVKRKLSMGDKMAGRHGNKGVVSCILPEEDMPFFADGTPMDIVLNPLGVPSRMNIGQIMETHLGWGALELGRKVTDMLDRGEALARLRQDMKEIFDSDEISRLIDELDDDQFTDAVNGLRKGIITKSPVFDGAHEDEIWNWLGKAGLPNDGKCTLYDGRTGQEFHNKVTVGTMYMLKLHHLVDEKIHARSTGPYSLVTQQPLGGKAQFGGQRLGEMEVWAMEAYGAAHVLQEFLTVKSDDVTGRVHMYEKIVKDDNFLEAGLPESFNVLIKELMSLGLDVTLLQDEKKKRRSSIF